LTIKRVRVWIAGRVQGVWYRSNARAKAIELGLKGWVKNLWDGRVEAVFEGETQAIKEIIEWCKKGPPLAKVRQIEVKWEEPTGEFVDFFMK
jgi:acylphosphatase